MDDFGVSGLHESKNEWASRLVTILTPLVGEGVKSIFDEAVKLCKENGEMDKYLMTFQNFISRIPKWNATIIETEKNRIVERSSCGYLEDLVTCVHIIQLKLLSAVRVGQKQKKIDVNIPKLDDFIHKIYINVARKIYKNVYLFEINIAPLQVQKNHRELEVIIQECILNTVRESIPVESILRAYMDETVEEDVIEEIKEQIIEESIAPSVPVPAHINTEQQSVNTSANTPVNTNASIDGESIVSSAAPSTAASSNLSFNDVDFVRDVDNNEATINAPKDDDSLERISALRNAQRKLESEEDDDGGSGGGMRLNISDQNISLDSLDVQNIDFPDITLIPDLLNDIEILV
jgi:hypothetical protein